MDSVPDLKGKVVYAVDSNNLIFQVFHAIPEMTSPKGEPVAAVYGFVRDVVFLLEEKKPDYLFLAFDLPGGTFRNELFDQYKVHRAEMPDDLVPQFPAIRRFLDALGVAVLECENYEADDILATLARICDEGGAECYLVTSDKDCRQLITDHVRLFNVRKNQVLDSEALQQEWGIRPDQVVDFQALVGDSVDNVPGVPLIGPKVARELLEKYGTLASVLNHAEEVSGTKRRENLRNYRDQALLSRDLVRLERNAPIAIDWNRARPNNIDPRRAAELCREWGFRGLTEKVSSLAADSAPLFATPKRTAEYITVDTLDALKALAGEMAGQPAISFDTETTNIHPRFADLVGLSFSWEAFRGYYVPVRAPLGERTVPRDEALEILRPIFENERIAKVGQNLKYDVTVLRAAGVEVRGLAFDTMVASYLLEAGARTHNLDELAQRYLDHETIKISELIGTGKRQITMDLVPVPLITNYAAEDAEVTWRLKDVLERRLQEEHLDGLMRDLEVPLIEVLQDMEFRGIRVDPKVLERLSRDYEVRIAAAEQRIYDLAGHSFNIASPKQLSTVLFEEQGLPVIKKTKTGPSTDADVLEELARVHPLPAQIIEYRQFAKLKSTYVDSLPKLIHPRTGRVHTSFNQVVAATGRLSSNDPNLQNIPVRNDRGREIRAAFLPGEPGWKLLAADYSQIELRVLAHFSRDEALCEAFQRDEDIHTAVAAQVHGVSPEDVNAEMRRGAKAVNFGIIYGQSPFGLSKQLGIDQAEAARFIDAYFDRYPGVERFMNETLATCRKRGYVTTILGRRREIQGVRDPRDTAIRDAASGNSRPTRQRTLPERTAINTVIQGSAADVIKQAMLNIHRRLKRESWPAYMLLQIHDELIFETPAEEVPRLGEMVRAEMGAAIELSVPLKVDLKSGDNWAACEK